MGDGDAVFGGELGAVAADGPFQQVKVGADGHVGEVPEDDHVHVVRLPRRGAGAEEESVEEGVEEVREVFHGGRGGARVDAVLDDVHANALEDRVGREIAGLRGREHVEVDVGVDGGRGAVVHFKIAGVVEVGLAPLLRLGRHEHLVRRRHGQLPRVVPQKGLVVEDARQLGVVDVHGQRDSDEFFVLGPLAPLLFQFGGTEAEQLESPHLLGLEGRESSRPRDQCAVERVHDREVPRLSRKQSESLSDDGGLDKGNLFVRPSRYEAVPVGQDGFVQAFKDLDPLSNGVCRAREEAAHGADGQQNHRVRL